MASERYVIIIRVITEFNLKKKEGRKKKRGNGEIVVYWDIYIDRYFIATKSRALLSQHGRYDATRFKWSKNVFNRVVHYQLVRGIDGKKKGERGDREGIKRKKEINK